MEDKKIIANREITIREEIMNKIYSKNSISQEERIWLETHCVYNRLLGFPYLNSDIIHLSANSEYQINVKWLSATYDGRILPEFRAPCGKGSIITNFPVTDMRGKTTTGKPIKALGCLVDKDHKETTFVYKSELGCFALGFECEYYDEKMKLFRREHSTSGYPALVFKREEINETEFVYYCKAPTSDEFNSLIFRIKIDHTSKTGDSSASE